jgi:hypothetical protein
MTGSERRRPVPDRARRRAIRALATRLGVAYSVAARLLAEQATPGGRRGFGPSDEHRAWLFAMREQRPFYARVHDTRQAADLPLGRAAHLTARFPRLRAGTAVGPLYDGPGRQTALAMLYAVLAYESPQLLPSAEELTWVGELGEEAAVDVACAALDRAARLLLDGDRWRLWTRVEAALAAGEGGTDRRVRDWSITLGRELRAVSLRGSLGGVRHILDALLVEAYEGHPPGVRVHVDGRPATVVGARWSPAGPPTGYEVCLDGDPTVRVVPTGSVDKGQSLLV